MQRVTRTFPAWIRQCSVGQLRNSSHKPISPAVGTSQSVGGEDERKLEEGMFEVHVCSEFHVAERWHDDRVSIPQQDNSDSIPAEYGNKPKGPEPTRFGDWQYKGRSTDF
jgi:hypothetical protein